MRHSAFIYETDLHLLLIYQCHVGVRRARSEGGTLLAHGLFNPTLWPQDIPTSSLSELVSDVDVVPRLADTEEGDSEYCTRMTVMRARPRLWVNPRMR